MFFIKHLHEHEEICFIFDGIGTYNKIFPPHLNKLLTLLQAFKFINGQNQGFFILQIFQVVGLAIIEKMKEQILARG